MRPVLTLARREVRSLFDTPAGYVLLVVFLVVNGFLAFRQIYVMGYATLRPMLDTLPWLLLFFVPAVTMRALAEDTRSGQLEVVLSQPITEFQLLLGKYLGAVLFLAIALLATLPIPLGLRTGTPIPWGPVVAQYTGALLLAAGLAGVGVWASGIARSQITAFILSVAVMFALVLVGLNPLVVGLPPRLGVIAARLGVLSHFDNIGRGVIDLRDLVYFVSLAAIFLTLAFGSLMTRKLAAARPPVRRLRLGVLLLVALLVVTNLLGSYIGGRLDLTPGHSYTLAPATRQLVRTLPDIVTLKVFASEELPAEVGLLKRDLDDLLGDLRAAGRGNIKVLTRDPSTDPAARQEAQSLGVQPVQFNVVGQGSLSVKEGYLGLVIQYAGGNEPIPFVRSTDDLEYRIASAIRSLTRTEKPALGIMQTTAPDPRQGRAFGILQQQLSRSYDLRTVLPGDTVQLADTALRTLVIAGQPDSLAQPTRDRLRAFLAGGGSALLMASGAPLSAGMPRASGREPVWNSLLQPYGVKIRPDLVYDLSANQIVPFPTSDGGSVYQPYPFWVRARAATGSVVTEGVGEVFLPWASSIDTTGARHGAVTPLLTTTRAGGIAEGEIDLNPQRFFPQDDLRPRLLAVLLQPAADTASPRGRLVVVGNADFATDRYLSSTPENGAFALNAIDWLAQDEALISIRSRDRRPPRLLFSSPALQAGVKYLNLIVLPLGIALWGVLRLVRRRRRALEPWRPSAGMAPAEA